ncbi:MAG: ABC transporter ATP-binding protein [Pseudomonadota bacterium]
MSAPMKINLRNIGVSLGKTPILRNLTASFQAGTLVGVVGPNGAAKTTLLRAIATLVPLDGGHIEIDGKDVSALSPPQIARSISYLPQRGRINWNLKVHDVVALGRHQHQRTLFGRDAGHAPALQNAISETGLNDLVDRDIYSLSGGELSRVFLARALAVEAPILLADEPTSSLDPYNQLQTLDILRNRAKAGTCIIVVLHDMALAMRFCDRVVLMKSGSIVADGVPKDVLTEEAIRSVYGVSTLTGYDNGQHWVIPWDRTTLESPVDRI